MKRPRNNLLDWILTIALGAIVYIWVVIQQAAGRNK